MARPPQCGLCPKAFECVATDSYPVWGKCQRCGSAWYHTNGVTEYEPINDGAEYPLNGGAPEMAVSFRIVRAYERCPAHMQRQPDPDDQDGIVKIELCEHCRRNTLKRGRQI